MRRAILSNVVCRFAPNFFKLSHKWHDFRDRLLAARQTPNLEDLWLEPSNSRHKVPSVWNDTSEPQQRKVEISDNFAESGDFHVTFWFLLHAVNLRHWTDGFTSPPKEGALRVFFAWNIRRLRPGLSLRTWVPKASRLISRPTKPLTTYV